MRRLFGTLVRVLGKIHLWIASYHAERKRVHDRRSAHHAQRQEARLNEAAEIDSSAATLAPPKPAKVKVLPPQKRAPEAITRTPPPPPAAQAARFLHAVGRPAGGEHE